MASHFRSEVSASKQRTFDGLFKHLPIREGNFASRWSSVLQRLGKTDIDELVKAIRRHITVLNSVENRTAHPAGAYEI